MADELGANSDTDSASDDLHVEVWDFDDRQPPLVEAAMLGHNAEVRSMLAEGADVNNVGVHGYSALTWASTCNHLEIATALLEHGSDVNKPTNIGVTPMSAPCALGNLAMAQLLSSYGAARTFTIDRTKWTAEEYATFTGHTALAAWLVSSRKWTTPLHHLTIIPATRAHALLRNGASILAAAAPGDPTPLSLARELHAKGEAAEGSAAALVLSRWRPRLLALAMGTHTRLGAESPFRHLGGTHGLLETIAERREAEHLGRVEGGPANIEKSDEVEIEVRGNFGRVDVCCTERPKA